MTTETETKTLSTVVDGRPATIRQKPEQPDLIVPTLESMAHDLRLAQEHRDALAVEAGKARQRVADADKTIEGIKARIIAFDQRSTQLSLASIANAEAEAAEKEELPFEEGEAQTEEDDETQENEGEE